LQQRLRRAADWKDKRRSPARPDDDEALCAIKSVIFDMGTYGYRRVWGTLRYQGIDGAELPINHKRVYRLMRDHGLLIWRRGEKRVDTRQHDGRVAVSESNIRWCSDGFELACDNGERVRVAFAMDCCDREVMSWCSTTKGIDANLVGDIMMQAVETRFGSGAVAPHEIEWLTDNGSCYTSHETRAFARELGLKPVRTPIESPQSNGMAESFVKTFKRDYAALAVLRDSETVMSYLPVWFEHYNAKHPHSALKYLSPRMFRQRALSN
jgi:putative transposase